MDKTHVQHAVSFVQHKVLDLRQVNGALLMVIQQTTRRCDQDVDTTTQSIDLRVHAHATKNHHGLDGQVFAVNAHAFFDLRGQFTGGRQDQGANGAFAGCGRLTNLNGQFVQQGQGETGCFARSCLGARQ